MLYMIYLVLDYKYKEYQINSNSEYLESLKNELTEKIKQAESIIEYKSTTAYRNKVLKEHEWLKNKWEKVLTLITEKKYEKFTTPPEENLQNIVLWEITSTENLIATMNIYQRWIYFIFHKDIR